MQCEFKCFEVSDPLIFPEVTFALLLNTATAPWQSSPWPETGWEEAGS